MINDTFNAAVYLFSIGHVNIHIGAVQIRRNHSYLHCSKLFDDGRTYSSSVARTGNDLLVRGKLAANEQVVTTAFAEIGPGVQVQAR